MDPSINAENQHGLVAEQQQDGNEPLVTDTDVQSDHLGRRIDNLEQSLGSRLDLFGKRLEVLEQPFADSEVHVSDKIL
eukprot:12416734-Karenia_brevis.AAC.1